MVFCNPDFRQRNLDAAILLTIGSFLLTVGLLCLQLLLGAFWLTIGASLLTVGASLLTVEASYLEWKMRLISTYKDCKQRSSTASNKKLQL